MIKKEVFFAFLFGVLLVAVPLAYVLGQAKLVRQVEQYRMVALECTKVSKTQQQHLSALQESMGGG